MENMRVTQKQGEQIVSHHGNKPIHKVSQDDDNTPVTTCKETLTIKNEENNI